MKSFALGLILSAVLVAAVFVTPKFLPASPNPATLDAEQAAELARRQLNAYDTALPPLGSQASLDQLKQAEFEQLVQRDSEQFNALGERFSEEVRRVRSLDQRSDMPAGDLRAVSMNASGISASVGSFERQLQQNQKLLADAGKSAGGAGSSGREIASVGQIAGAINMTEAENQLSQARRVRAEITGTLGELFAAAAAWKGASGERDYNSGLKVSDISDGLSADVVEIESAAGEARDESAALRQSIATLESELKQVMEELGRLRAQRIEMEKTGFTAGNDSSFNSYRDQYVAVGARMVELQLREQELEFGAVAGDEAADEQFIGLNELKRRLAVAEEREAGLAEALSALNARRDLVAGIGGEAEARGEHYAKRLDTVAGEARNVHTRVIELQKQATDLEAKALNAAQQAASAYGRAKAAVSTWKGNASALQSKVDPQRLNDRLKEIAKDDFASDYPTSSEAQAKILIGRIQTERALGIANILDTIRRASEMAPALEFDISELQGQYDAAREEAVKSLGEARDLYERLAQKSSNTSWVHQASLAMIYHLLAQVDEAGANQHRSNLIDQLGKAIANRTQSPHLRREVELYTQLTGESAAPTREAPQPDAAEEEAGDSGDGGDGS